MRSLFAGTTQHKLSEKMMAFHQHLHHEDAFVIKSLLCEL